VLRVLEVATGKEAGGRSTARNFGPPSWTDDNLLLYNRLPSSRPTRRGPTSI
jgi:hypothetical protein